MSKKKNAGGEDVRRPKSGAFNVRSTEVPSEDPIPLQKMVPRKMTEKGRSPGPFSSKKKKKEERIWNILTSFSKPKSRFVVCDIRLRKEDLRIANLKKALRVVSGIAPHGISTIVREDKHVFTALLSEEELENNLKTRERVDLITLVPWNKIMLQARVSQLSCLAYSCMNDFASKISKRRGRELLELLKRGELAEITSEYLLQENSSSPHYHGDVTGQ